MKQEIADMQGFEGPAEGGMGARVWVYTCVYMRACILMGGREHVLVGGFAWADSHHLGTWESLGGASIPSSSLKREEKDHKAPTSQTPELL